MINKLIDFLKKPARLILIIGSFLYLLLFVLINTEFGDTFFSVFGGITILITGVVALAVTPVFLLLKKDNIAKIVFTFLAGYWLISTILSSIGAGNNFEPDGDALFNTASIFTFILGLTLLAAVVLFILSVILKNNVLRLIAFIVVLAVIAVALLSGIFWLAMYGKYAAEYDYNVPFQQVVNIIANYFILPPLVCIGAIEFYLTSSSENKALEGSAE